MSTFSRRDLFGVAPQSRGFGTPGVDCPIPQRSTFGALGGGSLDSEMRYGALGGGGLEAEEAFGALGGGGLEAEEAFGWTPDSVDLQIEELYAGLDDEAGDVYGLFKKANIKGKIDKIYKLAGHIQYLVDTGKVDKARKAAGKLQKTYEKLQKIEGSEESISQALQDTMAALDAFSRGEIASPHDWLAQQQAAQAPSGGGPSAAWEGGGGGGGLFAPRRSFYETEPGMEGLAAGMAAGAAAAGPGSYPVPVPVRYPVWAQGGGGGRGPMGGGGRGPMGGGGRMGPMRGPPWAGPRGPRRARFGIDAAVEAGIAEAFGGLRIDAGDFNLEGVSSNVLRQDILPGAGDINDEIFGVLRMDADDWNPALGVSATLQRSDLMDEIYGAADALAEEEGYGLFRSSAAKQVEHLKKEVDFAEKAANPVRLARAQKDLRELEDRIAQTASEAASAPELESFDMPTI